MKGIRQCIKMPSRPNQSTLNKKKKIGENPFSIKIHFSHSQLDEKLQSDGQPWLDRFSYGAFRSNQIESARRLANRN